MSRPAGQSCGVRRALLPSAVGLVLALTAVTGCANRTVTPPQTPAHTAAVPHHRAATPWRPVEAHAGVGRHTTGPAAAHRCPPGGVAIILGTGAEVGGTYFVPITVRNHGPRPCTLHDRAVTLRWQPGHHAQLPGGRARTLPPDGAQRYRLAFAGSCLEIAPTHVGHIPATGSLNGAAVPVRGPGLPTFLSRCTTALLLPDQPITPEDAGTGPYSHLRAEIHLPDTVHAGATLHFILTLTNTASETFAFTDCPAYTEIANIDGQVSKASYTLNCTGVTIAANATTVFAMQIDLPAGTGVAKLGWLMHTGPSTVTAVNLS